MNSKNKGFGLVEVLLSALIFVILIGGISALSQRSISLATTAAERQFALGWAQEGIEGVIASGQIQTLDYSHGGIWLGYLSYNSTSGTWSLSNNFNMSYPGTLPCVSGGSFNLSSADWRCSVEKKTPFSNEDTTLGPAANMEFARLISIQKAADSSGDKYTIRSKVAWDTSASSADFKGSIDLSKIVTN